MSQALFWERDGQDWPHRETSAFIQAGGLCWHVQRMGRGPVLLLLHGTGASTHSWRDLMPLLARRFTVVALDLPGHAFTSTPPRAQLSLSGMARLVEAVVAVMALDVAWIVGHSAGAAIGARLVLDGKLRPQGLAGINAALLPLGGLPGLLFPPVARLMAVTPLASQLFARRTWDASAVEKLIAGTGSTLDQRGLSLYGRLLRDARHAAGALGMMAEWDLPPLARQLAQLAVPVTLIVGARDRAIPPDLAWQVAGLMPATAHCEVHTINNGGHLVHEEHPAAVARVLLNALTEAPVRAHVAASG